MFTKPLSNYFTGCFPSQYDNVKFFFYFCFFLLILGSGRETRRRETRGAAAGERGRPSGGLRDAGGAPGPPRNARWKKSLDEAHLHPNTRDSELRASVEKIVGPAGA